MAAHADTAGTARSRTLCLTGPESTGKTTLARGLAERLGATLVEEVARKYLERRPRYAPADLLTIATLQVEAEARARSAADGLLICDTDLTVIQVWWEEKFGDVPEELHAALEARTERAYLLLEPDLPWVPDPLRENPADRYRLFARYQALLDSGPFPSRVVSGSGAQRLENALAHVRSLYPDRIKD